MISRSQLVTRALLAVASAGLIVLTVLQAPQPFVAAAIVLGALTAYAAARPGSSVVTLLLAGHSLHWLLSVPVPGGRTGWLALLLAAWLGLLLHLSASLAASLPGPAAIPSASLRRWTRRAAAVTALMVPVWGVAALSGQSAVAGDAGLTYAAIAAVAVLAVAVWLFSREPRRAP